MENKINYYSEDKEQFADVYIKKDLIFKCRVNGLNIASLLFCSIKCCYVFQYY